MVFSPAIVSFSLIVKSSLKIYSLLSSFMIKYAQYNVYCFNHSYVYTLQWHEMCSQCYVNTTTDYTQNFSFFLNIFIDYAITVVPFQSPTPLHPANPLPPTFPPYSSCPWVILISSLASTFPTLLLPSPCLFSTYHLCYLFSVPFPPSPPPTPLLTTLHVISISMVLFLF